MAKNTKPTFTRISANEIRLDYKGHKFILLERNQGIYGMGMAVMLQRLEGFDTKHMKVLGWTKGDNHGGEKKSDNLLNGIVTIEQCKVAAIKYIDSLL